MKTADATVRRMDETTSSICLWCSAEIPAGAAACAKCGALVVGAKAVDLPGVTEVDPNAKLPDEPDLPDFLEPGLLLHAGMETTASDEPTDEAAIAPPTPEVALEMKKMELEAQIANAGTDVIGPDDVTIEAGAPSDEALEAYRAGLLDKQGPAGEDMAAAAEPWEDPEIEARLAEWRVEKPE